MSKMIEWDSRPFITPVRVKFYRVLTGAGPSPEWHRSHQLHVELDCARSRMRRRSSLIMQKFAVREIPAGMYCAYCTRGLFNRVKGRYTMGTHRYEEIYEHWKRQFTSEYETVIHPCEVVREALSTKSA